MGVAVAIVIIMSVILAGFQKNGSRVGNPVESQPAIRQPGAIVAEIDRETAFAALQRLSINQQRLVDSTEAKLGVLALAVLALFVAILVDPEMKKSWLGRFEVIILGADVVAILLGLLFFKPREPFDVIIFVRGYKRQTPQTIENTIDAMATRYNANELLRRIKDHILTWSTWIAIGLVALDLGRRYGVVDVLSSFWKSVAGSLWRV